MALINGTNGNDVQFGTGAADTFVLKNGNDQGFGGGGNDTMFGEDGNDTLNGEVRQRLPVRRQGEGHPARQLRQRRDDRRCRR